MTIQQATTIIGRLVDDPDFRYTGNGVPVANFTIASSPRFYDVGTQEWKSAQTLYLPCVVWRDQAEHASESLRRGDRVIVTGRLVPNVHSVEVDVDDIGVSLKYAAVQPLRSAVASTTNQARVIDTDRAPTP